MSMGASDIHPTGGWIQSKLDTQARRRRRAAAAFREFGKIKLCSEEKGCIVVHSAAWHLSQSAARSD